MAKIRIKIDRNGDPTIIDVCGEGQNCMEKTKDYEKALGKAQENSRALTESYYEEEVMENLLAVEVTHNG